MDLRLPFRPPLYAGALLGWLGTRAMPGVEEVTGPTYRRSMRLPHGTAVVELTLTGDGTDGRAAVRLTGADPRDVPTAVDRCRAVADLDTDPAEVATALAADPLLARLVAARPGLRVPGTTDGFELACRGVLGQQISVAGARTLAGRLVTAFGEDLPVPVGPVTHLFPTADRLAGVALADLAGLGLTRARAGALLALAQAVAGGGLVLDRARDRPADRSEAARRLLALPGFGPWTVSYVAMRALGDPDALPAGDLILRRALPDGPLSTRALADHATRWSPWRAYAAMHLWAHATAVPAPGGDGERPVSVRTGPPAPGG